MTSPSPWWMTDEYTIEDPIPDEFHTHAGPEGLALVRAWDNGKTDPGWGLKSSDSSPGFMHKYRSRGFRLPAVMFGYEKGRWNFAFIMRSVRLICIDIDGKNGGLQHAGRLGMLPYTLAETSKSGEGFHLFYATSEDMWDADTGYAKFGDRIGIEQGVDIRAVGCVYHYPQQRWNGRPIAELPEHLSKRLSARMQTAAAQTDSIIKTLDTGDEVEVALMHDKILTDLKKPIPNGRRNTTLFAIGSQMYLAKVPKWDEVLRDRALAVGLDQAETNKLIRNVKTYGDK